MSVSDGFAEKALRYFRRQLVQDEDILSEHAEDLVVAQSAYQSYWLPCLYCAMEFRFHVLGTDGRADLVCSDYCAGRYGKGEKEQDWEECISLEFS